MSHLNFREPLKGDILQTHFIIQPVHITFDMGDLQNLEKKQQK